MRQIKLFIFDMEEKLVATLENKNSNACPVEVCVIKEALNGAFTLEFEIPNDHDDLDKIKEKYFVVVKDADDKNQLFIIQEIEDSHENELNKRVFCDHASIELADEVIEELLIDRKNSVNAFNDIMLGSKWTIGTLEATTDVHDLTVRLKNRREVVETFLNRWGVEISYEVELSGATIFKRVIHIHLERGDDIGKRLTYGHNVESIRRTINADHVKTALYGKGQEINTQTASETGLTETEELAEEAKRFVDFGGLDWSTVTQTLARNLLPTYQASPTKTKDLNAGAYTGSVKTSISTAIPTGVEGVTRSFRATQTIAPSIYMVINNAFYKTRVTSGQDYTYSGYVRTNKAGATLQLQVFFYDSKGKFISSTVKTYTSTTDWLRMGDRQTTPTGASLAKIEFKYRDTVVNDWLEVTGLMVQEQTLTDFVLTERIGAQEFNKPKGQKWIGDETARLKWGRYNPTTGLREHRFGIYENTSISDPVELLLDTYAQLPSYTTPQITYEVNEIALGEILGLSQLKTRLGDQTVIIDKDLDITIQARAIERESDLIDESNSDLVFGDFVQLQSIQQLKRNLDLEARLDIITTPPLPETILEEGATIPTDWLEGEINALKNEIIAGTGTVTITETNGILIETVDKTKALRLLGGMLALADEKDPITGEYNWRSFGTGEGFLADLVQTGFIRFERAKGGQLTLGGEITGYEADGTPIYENGTLVVYGSEMEADGRPIVVNLSGDQGGFDKLSIGELTNIQGTNIITSTHDYFHTVNQDASGNIIFYVDPVDGNDANTGTSASPKRTVQNCIDLLPKFLERNVYIYVLPTLLNDPEILIEGFVGHAFIYIQLWDVGANTRYIRDWLNGSTSNTSNHWVEVRAIRDTGAQLHAGGTTYPERINYYRSDTMSSVNANATNGQRASDGTVDTGLYSSVIPYGVPIICDIYLGGVYSCTHVETFHYWGDSRTYHDTKIQISEDGTRWYTIFDSDRQGEYAESASGKRVDLKYFILNGRIKVNTCMVNVRCNNAYVNGEGVGNPTIDAHHTNYFEMRDSVVFGDPTYDYAVYANGSNVRVHNSEVNLAETAGLISAYGGRLEVVNVKGSGFPYALYAHSSGIVAGTGMSPVGTTAQKYTHSGGTMTATWTATSGVYYKAPITQKTSTWTANDTQSLYGTNWTLTSNIYQGKRPTEATAWYGVAFFNTASFAELAGRPIKSVRVKLQRSNNTGENTSRKPKIYYNMQTSASGSMQTLQGGGHVSSVGFTWGEEKWITLPISYGEAFRDGTAKSLVLYYGTSESQYMKMEPKATLEITHG